MPSLGDCALPVCVSDVRTHQWTHGELKKCVQGGVRAAGQNLHKSCRGTFPVRQKLQCKGLSSKPIVHGPKPIGRRDTWTLDTYRLAVGSGNPATEARAVNFGALLCGRWHTKTGVFSQLVFARHRHHAGSWTATPPRWDCLMTMVAFTA